MTTNEQMKLDEALQSARVALAQTPVPEQDAAVARAHMLAAFARSADRHALSTLAKPETIEASARASLLATAGESHSTQDNDHPEAGRYGANKMKWFAALGMLILAAIWLQMPVDKLANSNDLLAVSSSSQAAAANNSSALMRDFVPLVDSTIWQSAQRGWVVPTELPITELASMGLPFDATQASDTVPAELLMSESGELLGVRLLNASAIASKEASPSSSSSPPTSSLMSYRDA